MIDKLHVHEFVQGVVEGDIFINYYNCENCMILICTLAFMLCVFLLLRGYIFVHLESMLIDSHLLSDSR